MMDTVWTLERASPPERASIHHIGTADVWDALRRGWDDFLATPTQLIFLAIIYPIIGLIAANAMAGRALMPLIWPVISGFALVGPLAALGIYELSRRREKGLPVSWVNALDVRHSPAFGSILGLGAMLLVLFVVWLLVAEALYAATIGDMQPTSIRAFADRLFGTPEGLTLIVVGNAVGFLFALAVLMLTVISFPMLLDRGAEGRAVDAATAIRTSIRAVRANPLPMALWGLIVGVLLLLGSLPLFVGLAVAVPVLGHATWHLYRKVVTY
ncbi:DUF2189 domain-containing protein [Roseomonas sp. M0104]|uniref:DUF2189 domain-containing protein n=1 Tax=Teichococcus coralli TaxID=2545983 RepID=A0A845B7S6_9PROT|nr:DUF2189 domain-containing protein [Pseudoroseomonas coralli]MXP62755.1 DUF2189 domain-containing protein [Pseudoroseomonas coralli]